MTFLRNTWYVAGFSEEVGRKPIARTFLDEPVVMFRKESGEIVAMDNRCAHRMAPLDGGRLVGDAIQCPYHGLQFGSTGACVKLPSGGLAPPRARLKVYPVVERYEIIWIWMGEPDLAQPDAIADFSKLLDPDYGWFNGHLHCKGNFQLMVDNLLDLSHTEFLHPLLSSDGWSARNKQKIEQVGDTITVFNKALDDNAFALVDLVKPGMGKKGTTIQTERWDPPSLILLVVDYYSGDDSIHFPSGHFLTPETEKSTHYFVRGGQGIAPQSAEFTEGTKRNVLGIFETQDIPIIEAQQRFLGDEDLMLHEPAILEGDAGSTRARRWLKKLINEEALAGRDGFALHSEPVGAVA